MGGQDLDGDGLPDLVVSAYERSVGIGNELGSVWMVPGYFLASIEPEPWTGNDPDILWPFAIDDTRYRLNGWIDDEEFGASLALVPNVTSDGRPGIAIGAPLANLGGLYESGGVRIHVVDTSASGTWGHFLDPDPVAVFGGENHHGDGAEVGDRLYGGVRQGEPTLLIGAPGLIVSRPLAAPLGGRPLPSPTTRSSPGCRTNRPRGSCAISAPAVARTGPGLGSGTSSTKPTTYRVFPISWKAMSTPSLSTTRRQLLSSTDKPKSIEGPGGFCSASSSSSGAPLSPVSPEGRGSARLSSPSASGEERRQQL